MSHMNAVQILISKFHWRALVNTVMDGSNIGYILDFKSKKAIFVIQS